MTTLWHPSSVPQVTLGSWESLELNGARVVFEDVASGERLTLERGETLWLDRPRTLRVVEAIGCDTLELR